MKFKPYNHSEAALNERIALIVNAEKKKGGEKEALRTIFQSIDFTTLEATVATRMPLPTSSCLA